MSMHRLSRFAVFPAILFGTTLGMSSHPLWASDGGSPADISSIDPAAAEVGPGPGAGGIVDPCADKNNRKICQTFETSLHNTRSGKARHYAEMFGGFEEITGVPYEDLSCQGCHKVNPLAPDPYEPSCYDCHADSDADIDNNAFNEPVPDERCLGCHGRQGAERTHPLLAGIDVHVKAGMQCMDCHHEEEMHGDGRTYSSLQEAGALKVSCTQAGCHDERELVTVEGQTKGQGKTTTGVSARAVSFHEQHLGGTDCSACHVQSVLACDSCHFDTEIALPGVKRFYAQSPRTGFKFLMNKEGKVRTATYQSLTWKNTDAFYVMAPYVAHTIASGEAVQCEDCHVYAQGQGKSLQITGGNAALVQYLSEGRITVTKWIADTNPDDDIYGALAGPSGVIPVPPDWAGALEFDHVYWTGSASDGLVSGGAGWDYLKTGADRVQMPFGSPLSEIQIDKLILRQ